MDEDGFFDEQFGCDTLTGIHKKSLYFFMRYKKDILQSGRKLKRMCCRLNHKCARMRKAGEKIVPIVYCPINGECICAWGHKYDCKCWKCNCTCKDDHSGTDLKQLPWTCTAQDMKYITSACALIPLTLRKKDLREKMNELRPDLDYDLDL